MIGPPPILVLHRDYSCYCDSWCSGIQADSRPHISTILFIYRTARRLFESYVHHVAADNLQKWRQVLMNGFFCGRSSVVST